MLLFKLFIYLFWLGLCCCLGFSLVAKSRGYSRLQWTSFSLQWLLVVEHTRAEASVVAAHGFNSCGTWA